MDDAALERAWAGASAESQALARGTVAGYNRYLADQAGKLPAACNGQPWVKPMTLAEFRRQGELTAVQAATAALADAVLGARPPAPTAALATPVDLADAAAAMREAGLLDSPLGSNAWAFGRETTANGNGLLLGNPHFPWAGVNRFWQVQLTIPGSLDVMGVGIGSFPGVTIGFNKDVAWSHTVSTGKRFTLHEQHAGGGPAGQRAVCRRIGRARRRRRTVAALRTEQAGGGPARAPVLRVLVHRAAGFALDATLGSVQRPPIAEAPIPLHGGDEFEGVLNNRSNQFTPGIGPKGLPIDYGTSYVQRVTFDARGPVAQALLTYGQSTDPASPRRASARCCGSRAPDGPRRPPGGPGRHIATAAGIRRMRDKRAAPA